MSEHSNNPDTSDRKVARVAIVGVGNCASALVQGAHYYSTGDGAGEGIGLMNVAIGGCRPGDLEFTAAFDVDARKVGRDLAEAIFLPPNNTLRFCPVPHTGVTVLRGPTLDGIGRYVSAEIPEASGEGVDVAQVLRDTRTDVLVSYLPVGSEAAAAWYAEQALEAGCALVNCMPVFIASNPGWAARFEEKGLPLVGDDVKSQVGATIVHRTLVALFRDRGVRLDRTYQLNFGGNTDFLNMLERERLASKKISKTRAVTCQIGSDLPSDDVHIGPSDYVPWLRDRKWCHLYLEGTAFGGAPLRCEVKLEVWDSPNSAGVVIDAVRCARLALERRIGGVLEGPSAYFMKSPPRQMDDPAAYEATQAFIHGD